MKPDMQSVENELDIRGLCYSLWYGKLWIVGIAAFFAMVALAYSYLVKQEWSTTAITDKPTVSMLGGYYSQEQFLRGLTRNNSSSGVTTETPITEDVYGEFIMQLSSYDSRRDFWLQSDYYKQRKEGEPRADAVLLDELINNIVFTPKDDKKGMNDSIKLTAETPSDANQLLRQYINFTNQKAVSGLNEELEGTWLVRKTTLANQLKRQEEIANAVYQRELKRVQHALSIAEQQGITRSQTDVPVDQLPNSELFLLGKPMLQARYETLQASGPDFDNDYDHDRAVLSSLDDGVKLDTQFKTYRYLRTPEDPITRDKPRRMFLLIMWGGIGGLVGAGIALTRRRQNNN
ncbi:ECA polysaccharide chain length modulation protein [Pragia fontium]|uniref:ECA polysaccharide chain length modulation protein n=2 Tax=Pragia fontium TaxID=82985 RepID=A0AAJ4WD65_9GAMM|nr:ECA polysaccharide chain length modulation protein [Pragia fontium]AKJ43665.1 lipopolysaccharide biosynthesis protein WzzE [Pragia fontium]SFD34364.1 lipopolysaccharide biosynthesis protein WzzE [Pragia fontium DSM 5563 = ATCC 49100]SUB84163.1 Lipopolysaccharide biosynthesis protein wzzE [Pragia fontium]VEJ57056.1 Lipopolysaccharide biosynthesis protein wzzE [Pragia fontium]GKX64533.1 polysaccharide chain length modulation protein [Pragia fontium]